MVFESIVESSRNRAMKLSKNPDDYDLGSSTVSLKQAIKTYDGGNPIIAEIKPASPSMGVIKEVNVEETASMLADNSCVALSILTEPHYFNGSNDNLITAKRTAENIPVLRKDFIVSTSQLYESKSIGADAVLLIAAVLGDETVLYVDKCHEIGMEPLVEVHDEKDVETVLGTNAALVGINNRNLKTMEVDLETTVRLSGMIPSDRTIISESGIHSPGDITKLKDHCDAFLVGTSIMKASDPGEKLRKLICA